MSLSEQVELLEEECAMAKLDLEALFSLCYLIVKGGDAERAQSIRDLGVMVPIIQKRHSFMCVQSSAVGGE